MIFARMRYWRGTPSIITAPRHGVSAGPQRLPSVPVRLAVRTRGEFVRSTAFYAVSYVEVAAVAERDPRLAAVAHDR